MTLQIYGRFAGYWSHSQVSRGVVTGLFRNGLHDMQICTVDRYGGYEGLPVRVASGCHASAPVGFYIGGYPPQVGPRMEDHACKVGLFIAESATIPTSWAMYAADFDLVLVPSKWTRDAYVDAGVKNVYVVHHGLHDAYCKGLRAKPTKGPLQLDLFEPKSHEY